MDRNVECTLKKMGLHDCISLFKAHEITFDIMMKMSPIVLQTVFAGKAGLLAKFEEKHKEFSDKRLWTIPETQRTATGEDSEGEESETQSQFEAGQGFDVIDSESQRRDREESSETGDEDSESASSATPEETPGGSNGKRKTAGPRAPPNKKQAKSNEVEDVLKGSAAGKTVLRYKGSEKELPTAVLSKLGELVINHEIGDGVNHVITPSRFATLAHDCASLFPAEPVGRFYVPRKPAVGTLPAVQPRGSLYDKYHVLLRFLRKHGNRKSIRKDGQDSGDDEENEDVSSLDITWLKENSLVSERVTKDKWDTTTDERIRELRCTGDRKSKRTLDVNLLITVYFDKYPCLAQPWGLDLILRDFENLYGNQCMKVIEGWCDVKKKLLILLKKDDADFGSNAELLRFLPRLFKQPTVFHGSGQKREAFKPSLIESQDGFLLHVKTNAGVEDALKRIGEKCAKVKKPLQPLPIIVGPALHSIEACYVAIDKLRYKVNTPLEAVDCCFKVYQALHANYPCQSSYTWQFLQQAVYNLNTPWDMDAPSVTAKVSQYRKIKV